MYILSRLVQDKLARNGTYNGASKCSSLAVEPSKGVFKTVAWIDKFDHPRKKLLFNLHYLEPTANSFYEFHWLTSFMLHWIPLFLSLFFYLPFLLLVDSLILFFLITMKGNRIIVGHLLPTTLSEIGSSSQRVWTRTNCTAEAPFLGCGPT